MIAAPGGLRPKIRDSEPTSHSDQQDGYRSKQSPQNNSCPLRVKSVCQWFHQQPAPVHEPQPAADQDSNPAYPYG